jgi:L-lysine 6-transaminase
MVRSSKIMEIIEEDNLCENAARVGEYLQHELSRISERNSIISNVRGKGLLTAFDFPDKTRRDKFIKEGMKRDVMFLGCGGQTIRFRPALIMDKGHIDEGLAVLEKILGIL